MVSINPFDPIHALHAAGKFLNKLVGQFGNLGLAAAAYNAGPGRVSAYVAKRRGLPEETRNYVIRITGKTADKWTSKKFVQAPEAKVMPAKAPCVEVAQEVAEQAKAAQLAQLASAQAAKQTGKLPRALKTVQTALKRVKGKAVIVLAAAKKLRGRADQACRPDRAGQERLSRRLGGVAEGRQDFGQQDFGEQDSGREGAAEARAEAHPRCLSSLNNRR